MLKHLAAYLGTAAAIAALDYVWLTRLSTKVYRPTLDPILSDKVAMTPAIIFYVVYVLGVVLLAVLPSRDGTWMKAAATGAILGAMAYATYDLTNQATLKVWATHITLIDIAWGAVLTAVGATAGWWAYRWAERTFA